MRRQRVESSAIRSVGYDPSLATLEIEFTSGEIYRYHAVPPSRYRALLDAESKGHYFLEHIRDVYPTSRAD
jgi:hypothetical protein